ncbi:HAMP domain-containing histidine kinase [bacterium]|jgi:two-component system, NtrC family, sensor histidine kinase HydH|nr:HAMP domain-containing histidine kinase [bacterium]
MNKRIFQSSAVWVGSISVLIVAVSMLHYGTHTHEIPLHALFRKLYYLPILMGAIRFGVRGGLLCSIVCTILYFPHLHFDWGANYFYENADKTLEIAMYQVIALIVGLSADYQRTLRGNLEDAHQNLEEKTKTLLQAKRSLNRHEKLQAMALLGAGISHEIRNPLASLKGILEMLFESSKEARDEELKSIATNEVLRIQNILDRFLKLHQEDNEETSEIDLVELLHQLRELMEGPCKKRGLRLEMETQQRPCIYRGPGGILQQVLINLILNSQEAARSLVHIKLCGVQSQFEIEVSDDGDGVAEESREAIFDFFFTTRKEGTGLGLSISSQLMDRLGGNLSLKKASNPTVFKISFPAIWRKIDGSKHDLAIGGEGV